MVRRERVLLAAAFCCGVLAGCNSARAPEPGAAAPAPASRADVSLPQGSGCSGAIARYRAIMDNDLSMGHVDKSVYDRIQTEIGEAQSACASGQDAKALSLLHASKARHGYPA
jgi:hypothetical protein